MWQIGLRVVVGLLLVIHGFAHYQITTGWGSRQSASSWLLTGLAPASLNSLGNALWVVTLLAFIAAGIAVFAGMGWWRGLAILASVLSLIVIGLFWQPNMILGAAVNIGILVALLWVHWPAPQVLGA
ncbi:MAG: hypothetical protein IT329_18375 [Caldilineaceae bacterium]|nr:hypothetical protein [Caldilineaceae bacterium]